MGQNAFRTAAVAILVGLSLASCGGPSSPSAGVVLRGTLVGEATGVSAFSGSGSGARDIRITVLENPSLSTTVNGSGGAFTFSGLPDGSFTLVFTSGGTTLGTIVISGVEPNQRITIVVRVKGGGVELADDDRDEGPPTTSPTEGSRTCMINGGRVGDSIELEGSVASGSSTGFMMNIQGNRARGPVQVDASGASFKCNGSKGTDQQCRASVAAGAKVHVKGTLQSCDASTALARAQEVKVQK